MTGSGADRDDDAVEMLTDAPAEPRSLAHAIGTRNLMIIIITMPLVFLIVVMAVISVFGRPGTDRQPGVAPMAAAPAGLEMLDQPLQPATGPSPASLALAPAPLVIPEGAAITSMALDGDRLVMRVEGVGDGELIVYDLGRGSVTQRIPVMAEILSADDL